jgi:hypothetical protein
MDARTIVVLSSGAALAGSLLYLQNRYNRIATLSVKSRTYLSQVYKNVAGAVVISAGPSAIPSVSSVIQCQIV